MQPNAHTKISKRIDADDKTLREILDTQKYTIDYFQREFRWERKHIEQLINDLETSFFVNYKETHERKDVEFYDPYYLGPIVVCNKEDSLSIIDGQQRLTSLTLLLIYIYNLMKRLAISESVESLIRSTKFGQPSYNLNIDDRIKCLDSLLTHDEYDPSKDDESVKNIVYRYQDIKELFPEDLNGGALPFFIDWLKEKIIFVKIVAYTDENAYKIFETMNDRGLNLTPTEMLKGYLLAKVSNDDKSQLNQLWRKRISELHKYDRAEDIEFFKAWLRAKYADTIRPGKKGAANEDFERIGTSFHTWVKDKRELIGLYKTSDFYDFINKNFEFNSCLYQKIAETENSENELTPNLGHMHYISYYPIAYSLSYPLLMAPIKIDDDEKTICKKIDICARFIETFIVFRSVNYRTLSQSSIRYTFYSLVKEVRDKTVSELIQILKDKIKNIDEGLSGILTFGVHSQNKRFVRYLLARITNFIEDQSSIASSFKNYVTDSIKKPFEIEHIWANNYNLHKDEFEQRDEFKTFRNKIGGLVLLQKGPNQAFGELTYEEKLPYYLRYNILASSLHKDCYRLNPGFNQFRASSGFNFKSYDHFTKQDLIERTELYKTICESIWSLEGFDEIANR